VSAGADRAPILRWTGPASLQAGDGQLTLEPFTLYAGEWLLLRPEREALGPDLAMASARVLATLDPPASGELELFGQAPAAMSYLELFQLRARLALIPGSGGLLASRTLRENIALPISVHAGLSHRAEGELVTAILQRFGLEQAADLYPHAVSGSTRLRTCVARATALTPELFIVEGAGEFVSESQVGLSWTRLAEARSEHAAAMVVCVSRHDLDFEAWFRGQGGTVLQYRLLSDLRSRAEGHVK
jgi:predicted ABC-type transport system involved in lysophospholipase L1 biosynthesis ATPase subunit